MKGKPTMTKIELARKAYEMDGSKDHVDFKQYFNFMWKNEKKERLENYIAYLQK